MITRKTLIGTLALMPLWLSAQSLSVKNATIDLGQIMFKSPVTATYVIKNSSSKSVTISDIDTGCGCVKAEYSSLFLSPSKEMKVDVTYDAKMLGHFERLILVKTEDGNEPLELTLRGNVVTKIETPVGHYAYKINDISCDINELTFDDVKKGKNQTMEMHIMNPMAQYIEPVIMHLPPYLRADVSPKRIAPNKTGVITFTLLSDRIRSFGLNQTSVYLAQNQGEKVSEEKEILVSAVVLPSSAYDYNGNIAFAPSIKLSTMNIDMRDFGTKAKKKQVITVTNTGKTELDITSIQMFTPGLVIDMSKRKIRPGTSAKMTVTGIADILKRQKAKQRILMITNDPKNPKVVIDVNK